MRFDYIAYEKEEDMFDVYEMSVQYDTSELQRRITTETPFGEKKNVTDATNVLTEQQDTDSDDSVKRIHNANSSSIVEETPTYEEVRFAEVIECVTGSEANRLFVVDESMSIHEYRLTDMWPVQDENIVIASNHEEENTEKEDSLREMDAYIRGIVRMGQEMMNNGYSETYVIRSIKQTLIENITGKNECYLVAEQPLFTDNEVNENPAAFSNVAVIVSRFGMDVPYEYNDQPEWELPNWFDRPLKYQKVKQNTTVNVINDEVKSVKIDGDECDSIEPRGKKKEIIESNVSVTLESSNEKGRMRVNDELELGVK